MMVFPSLPQPTLKHYQTWHLASFPGPFGNQRKGPGIPLFAHVFNTLMQRYKFYKHYKPMVHCQLSYVLVVHALVIPCLCTIIM